MEFPSTAKFLPVQCRLNKTLSAECMIVRNGGTSTWRERYGQNRFSCSGFDIGRRSVFAASACKSGEWSNCGWRGGWTRRRGVARQRPGTSRSSATAGLLCARAGIRRRAGLPLRSRALLGRVRMGIPPSPGLRLILRSPATAILSELRFGRPLFRIVRASG
jgi:hypothetical protein